MSNPPINLYDSSYPVAKAALDVLTTLLDKAQAHTPSAADHNLPDARLYEDMSPLSTQVHYVCDIVHNLVARTTNQDLSTAWPDDAPPATLGDLQARVAAARALVEAVEERVVNGRASETLTLETSTYGTVRVCVHRFVSTHVLPYLFFYLGMTYSILRKEGVPLRLMDYMGPFNNIALENPGLI
ncbi:hypothetical protein ISF_09205 [Cordyceps fumosorosea ARSEF 2679]|uniref:Uncharacterized protein n=1 Tax=Cordyceps fumosorosea (strain ARSEF 2679) TaxID=1081104 RepID=A0A167LCJ8_CORFA|nr:hypothetical protein ISF_09205 [Cordyceps fumosorosea ARSEF 2679]OAA52927.1 hypothetical protein ISF_09205 [Cordyceps fumosorosea ARSEF 2679]